MEIANELIPHIIKVESSGFSASTILRKPQCFANLLRFYDGICQWEEGSATPVLHIGWAKPLVNTISKFDADVRAQVNIICDKVEEDKLLKKNGTYFNNNNYEKDDVSANNEVANSMKGTKDKDETKSDFHPSIEALTAACSEKILNPEYLLQGDGSPFVGECKLQFCTSFILGYMTFLSFQVPIIHWMSKEKMNSRKMIKVGTALGAL